MISQFFAPRSTALHIVLNRYTTRSLGFDEDHITKALTMAPQWRIPDDYATAHRTQNTATAIALEDSPISRAIRQMARAACGVRRRQRKEKALRPLPLELIRLLNPSPSKYLSASLIPDQNGPRPVSLFRCSL